MADHTILGALTAASRRDFTSALERLELELVPGFAAIALRRRIVRPEDLLVLDVRFDNLRLQDSRLVRSDARKAARLIVVHQPQAFGEYAYQEETQAGGAEPGPRPPFTAPLRMAGPSRLVFDMPQEVPSLDWTLDAVLQACREWPLALDYLARPDPRRRLLAADWSQMAASIQRHVSDLVEALSSRLNTDRLVTTSLQRSAARLAEAIGRQGPGRQQPDDAQIARLVESELTRTFAQQRRMPAEQRRIATDLLSVMTLGRITAAAAAEPVGQVELAPILPILAVPHKPASSVTALELPWRVIHSPLATAGFTHALGPVQRQGRTEIWHSRLGRRAGASVDDRALQPLRALWSPDYDAAPFSDPLTTASNAQERDWLVRATTGFDEKRNGRPYTPTPGDARQLILTALGATLHYHGKWDARADGVPLYSWTHDAATGRDFYVRIAVAGLLYPFGHRAVKLKVTERKFETEGDGADRVATLRQRHFIIVLEPVRTFPTANMPHQGRDFPFRSVEILTRVTPNLAPPSGPVFWPRRSGADYLFDCVGVDQVGRRIPFSAPLAFVQEDKNKVDAPELIQLAEVYNAGISRARRPFAGAELGYAPVDSAKPEDGDTSLPTSAMTFSGNLGNSGAPSEPQFYPAMRSAETKLASVELVAGAAKTATMAFAQPYRDFGFGGENKGQVFLKALTSDSLAFGASGPGADKVGGLVAPNMAPDGYSRRFGVVGGSAAALASGTFNPEQVFGDAKLLGVLPLSKILHEVSDLVGKSDQVPKLAKVELPDRLVAEFRISQGELRPISVFEPNSLARKSQLEIVSRTTVMRNGGKTETVIDGSLTNFCINLFGFIAVNFDRLRFHSEPGKKTEVDVDLHPEHGIVFGGPLRFVNTLRDVIPCNGFSDPPDLSISPSGITASYSLALPTIQVGVLSLQNVSLGAGFSLPFTGGAPSVRFNFAERHNPFNLTVSLLGGGGFFLIGVDAEGVREVEAALEFGAQIAIDLGVASGRVYVKAGIYFHWQAAPDKLVVLEGYVEMGGELSVLGLISVSLTFHMALGYRKSGNDRPEIYGQAQLVVEVEVLFFSKSVTIRVERRFGGPDADPRFIDFVPREQMWRDYCAAFA